MQVAHVDRMRESRLKWFRFSYASTSYVWVSRCEIMASEGVKKEELDIKSHGRK